MQGEEKSRRVWTSYGIMLATFPNLSKKEKTLLQGLNRFFYDIAVSRV